MPMMSLVNVAGRDEGKAPQRRSVMVHHKYDRDPTPDRGSNPDTNVRARNTVFAEMVSALGIQRQVVRANHQACNESLFPRPLRSSLTLWALE